MIPLTSAILHPFRGQVPISPPIGMGLGFKKRILTCRLLLLLWRRRVLPRIRGGRITCGK